MTDRLNTQGTPMLEIIVARYLETLDEADLRVMWDAALEEGVSAERLEAVFGGPFDPWAVYDWWCLRNNIAPWGSFYRRSGASNEEIALGCSWPNLVARSASWGRGSVTCRAVFDHTVRALKERLSSQ